MPCSTLSVPLEFWCNGETAVPATTAVQFNDAEIAWHLCMPAVHMTGVPIWVCGTSHFCEVRQAWVRASCTW